MTASNAKPAPPDRIEVYRLALAEGRAAVDDLMGQPEKVRRNVGALLGFAAVAVTIFGVSPTQTAGWAGGACHTIAVIAVAGLVVCAAAVMAPQKLVPSMRADLIVGWGDAGDTEEGAVRNLAMSIEDNYQKNSAVVVKMFRWQIAATICFGVAVVMLAACTLGA